MPVAIASWITCKRSRAHGIILALSLWSVFLWNMSAPGLMDRAGKLKGTDFLHFYTLGTLALTHDGGNLYNMDAQAAVAWQRVPVAKGIRYLPLYPPQVSILFAPFARLTYPWALGLWLALSALLYGVCCYATWRTCPNLRNHKFTVVILALAFPAFWHLILWGQTSALALVCFTLAFMALRSRRELLAGLAFGCLIFKPQLAFAAAAVFLITLNWKVIAGAILSGGVQLIAACLYYGPGPLREWTSRAVRHTQPVSAARAPALSNPFPAHLLGHAASLAHSFICPLPSQRASVVGNHNLLLVQPASVVFAVFGSAARHRSARATSHRLRSRHSRAGVPVDFRLDRSAPLRSSRATPETPAVPGFCTPTAGSARALDAPSAFNPGHGRSGV